MYGPVRTVVWQGSVGDHRPYADQGPFCGPVRPPAQQLSFKEQVSNLTSQGPNTVFVGVEGIAQGNKDITSIQGGGLVQLTHVPWDLSVTLRAGCKHSSFESGPDKTGPYFGIGLYKRF